MDLHEGERVLLDTRPSWRSALGFYLLGDVLAAVVAGALIAAGQAAIGVAAGVAILVVVTLAGLAKRSGVRYVVTSQRLVLRRGLLSRTEQRVDLRLVRNIQQRQSFGQRLLGVGTVEFETSYDEPDVAFTGVDDPGSVVRAVEAAGRS